MPVSGRDLRPRFQNDEHDDDRQGGGVEGDRLGDRIGDDHLHGEGGGVGGRRDPSALSTIDLWHLGGAVAEVPRKATAFWHREEPHLLAVEANWDDPDDDEANVRWARDLITDIRALPEASGRYGNFPGLNEEPARAVYGDNYERLVDLKSRYDPGNLFPGNGLVEPHVAD